MSTSPAPIEAKPPTGPARYVPIIQWLPKYKGSFLSHDLIAALTVWALVVPEAMGYAGVAGIPVQYGLYAAPLAALAYMVFGGSRHLFVGPDAAPAAVSAAVVVTVVGANASTAEYVSATAMLALLAGLIFIGFGLLRLGWIAKFFAQPVLTGFIFGLGWFIAVSQLHKVVGIEKPSGDTVNQLIQNVIHIGDWQVATLLVGVLGLLAVFALSKFLPKLPSALILVVAGILAVSIFSLKSHGVEVVGSVPTGFHFAPWSSLSLRDIYELLPGAFAILLVSFSQSVALAKTLATENSEPFDPNQELLGYGAANLGAGVLQGYAATGSLSKTSLAEGAGARTPMNLGITGVLVAVTVLFLTGLFKNLPEAILGAIIIHAVSDSMNPSKMMQLWRANQGEFLLAALTAGGVLVFNILPGILIGVLLSFVLLIRRLDHPRTVLMGSSPDDQYFANLADDGTTDREGQVESVPGVLVYGFRAPLLFTNEDFFTKDLESRIDKADPRPSTVVLDCDAIAEVDTTGCDAVARLHDTLEGAGIRLLLARVNAGVEDYLRRDGALKKVGDDALLPSVRDAVVAAGGKPPKPEAVN
ncbi:MAG: SulP family inorganic anion transporter [Actinobacteria bacterium]|nr:SulP family inorganic anion transporter [Actinomycetota bacterium]